MQWRILCGCLQFPEDIPGYANMLFDPGPRMHHAITYRIHRNRVDLRNRVQHDTDGAGGCLRSANSPLFLLLLSPGNDKRRLWLTPFHSARHPAAGAALRLVRQRKKPKI